MRMLDFLRSGQLAGWAGQGIISATNFFMLLIVARWGGMDELGYYSLGFSIIAIMMAAQDSLVTKPYAIQIFKPPGGEEAHAYGTLAFGLALSALISAGLLGMSFTMTATGANAHLATMLIVLAAAAPLVLMRDFARRFCFANLQMHQALGIDIATCVLAAVLVAFLVLTSLLDASSALLCYSFAGGLAGAVWLLLSRNSFKSRPGAFRDTARQSWALGKWLLLSQVTLQLQGYAAHWIIAVISGAAATGIYSACLSVVALANPFLFGLLNFLTPKYVRAYKDGGGGQLRQLALRDTALICGVMGAFALLLVLAGRALLGLLFPAIGQEDASIILIVLAVASVFGSLGAPATIALSAIERGRAIAGLSVFALALGTVAVIALLPLYGLLGAAIGMLAVEIVGSVMRWALLLRATSSGGSAVTKSADQSVVEC
jgi:O-antigen/teichoic acid export membrane protein